MNDHACILIWDAHTRMGHNVVPYAYGPRYAYGAEQNNFNYIARIIDTV